MKRINCWNDLRPFGIEPLTGEACGLSYRLLCDVTQNGRHIIEKTLGIAQLALPDCWNRGDARNPHIGSIMLVPELLIPLAIFALLENGCEEVLRTKTGELIGVEAADDRNRLAELKRRHAEADNLVRRYAYAGTAGDRNRHEMTGRVI